MSKKMKLEFKGFEEYAEQLDKLGGDLKKTTEKALNETHKYLTPKIEEAFKTHDINFSHETMKSLQKRAEVKWVGTVAEIGVGFSVSQGGLASIFIMYGTPKIAPDKKLYNAIYGGKAKKEYRAIQEAIFAEEINKRL